MYQPARQVVLGVLTAGLIIAGLAMPATAAQDEPDIDTSADYLYVVDTANGEVDVTIELAVTADKPNQSVRGGTRQFYFTGYSIPIPGEAEEITVTDSSGRALEFDVDTDDDLFSFVGFDFRRNIFYRQTANVIISFVLPAGEPRSDDLARVNDAFAGFGIWTAPYVEEATVTVEAPRAFWDSYLGDPAFDLELRDGLARWVADDIDPEFFWTTVALTNDNALVTETTEVDGNDFTIRAWPGDTEWHDHVTESVEGKLAVLVDLVGVDWPIEDELTITESYSPYIHGYAGWFDPATNTIEIGDEIDDHLILHELSHVWFNGDLFDQRWITEGLADEFAAAAIETDGGDESDPTATSLFDSAAIDLNRWTQFSARDDEQENWAYGASWTVMHAIVEEVGLETLSEAVVSADAGHIAYLGDGAPEEGREQQDWRLFLDLLENRGDVTDDEVSDLFIDWVLTDAEEGELDDRAESRETYRELESAGGEWAPPLNVRQQMADWDFSAADDSMLEANEILTSRDETLELLAPTGASLPEELEEIYEAADESFDDIADLTSDAQNSAGELREAHDLGTGDRSIFQSIGLIGADVDTALADSVDAFEAGDFADASAAADDVDQIMSDAERKGQTRTAIAVGVLLFLAALVIFIRRRRRSRRQDTEATTTSEPPEPHLTNPEPAASDQLTASELVNTAVAAEHPLATVPTIAPEQAEQVAMPSILEPSEHPKTWEDPNEPSR